LAFARATTYRKFDFWNAIALACCAYPALRPRHE
jgi:hypothetical protein